MADDLSNFQTLIDITTDKDMHDNLLLVMRHLHGPNVYWAMDGGKSKTMFGTLHIRTTPLQVELHYEDCDDVVVFDIGKVSIRCSRSSTLTRIGTFRGRVLENDRNFATCFRRTIATLS